MATGALLAGFKDINSRQMVHKISYLIENIAPVELKMSQSIE